MTQFLFLSILLTVSICWVAALVSFLLPQHRIWPPMSPKSWKYWIVWPTSIYAKLTIPFLAFFDKNSLNTFQHHSLISGIALALLIGGAVFAIMSAKKLSPTQTTGLKGTLRTTGPYKLSRNPQYVGVIIFLMGLTIFSDSYLVLLVSLVYTSWYIFLPFVEEPWMKAQYGKLYEDYCKKVSRFL